MIAATTANTMSPGLLKVRERAERDPEGVLLALAHLIDEEALQRAYRSLRNEAAVGVDGITKEQYGQDLEHNVRDLHARMKSMRYRHQPIRRVHIPKERGKTRPIGISCTEDKIVQAAVREMLEVIYEPVFRDVSYGFRPGRSAHDALRALNRMLLGGVEWILEADIESFFDSIDRTKLMEMLQARVADKSLLRLVGKCLHVGVLDGAEFYAPEDGTVQGSVLSPLLGNVYLHHVLDLWIEREVQPRLVGKATPDPLRRRLHHRLREGGRRQAGDGGAAAALRAVRTEAASGQDPPVALRPPGQRAARGQGAGDLRLPRLHALLAAKPSGSMDAEHEDTQGAPPTGHHGRRRLLPTPSAPAGQGTARRAHTAHRRAPQLLRRQREPAEHRAPDPYDRTGMAQVAMPAEPACAPELEAVSRAAAGFPAA
nr:reverse transcriptase domain-containing protein [Sorangium cellulosum]